MPHTQHKEVWFFDELSDQAKDKAREWYRNGQLNYDWWDVVYDNVETAAPYLGIEIDKKPVKLMSGKTRYDPAIYFSGFASQGDGACFLGIWRAKTMKTTIELSAEYPTNKELQRIHAQLWGVKQEFPNAVCTSSHSSNNYSHKRSTALEAILDEDRDYNKEECEPVEELLVDFMQWIYKLLEDEYEWLNSNEQVDESITANEYEFTKEGGRA